MDKGYFRKKLYGIWDIWEIELTGYSILKQEIWGYLT